MPTPRPLSEQVRAAIERSELTRYRICQEIGLDQSAMSRFMAGERGLSLEVLDRLGLLLDLRLCDSDKTKSKTKR